jgi:hypothetical protein
LEHAPLTKTKRPKVELKEGPEARKNFEKTMKALFQVPKNGSKKKPKGKD